MPPSAREDRLRAAISTDRTTDAEAHYKAIAKIVAHAIDHDRLDLSEDLRRIAATKGGSRART